VLDPTVSGEEAGRLEEGLRRKIVGQDATIHEIVALYQAYAAGLSQPGRPVGNFLFLGPTGTGKTRTVEALAEILAGDARAVLKVDCGEYQHSHEVAKLIGSPPGYIGHRETHPALTQEVLDQYQTDSLHLSIVLFDEIEKASDSLWNLLLGILDKATLTLGDNRKVDFSRSMIFLTGNLGASEMMARLGPEVGFAPRELDPAGLAHDVEHVALEAARRRFTPEFLNRIDRILVFRPLGTPELRRILDLELNELGHRFSVALPRTPFHLCVGAAARGRLLEEGTDMRYGARFLKRAIERELVQPLSSLLATGQVGNGDTIRVGWEVRRGRFVFVRDEHAPLAECVARMPSPAPRRAVRRNLAVAGTGTHLEGGARTIPSTS
jgi:ATP-dependent Clp protease ATP-binding subunit ClpB